MKTYARLVTLCFLVTISCPAKIINGYTTDIKSARSSLNNLRILLVRDNSLSVFQRLSIYNKIDDLAEFITYHEFTAQMLELFRAISPELYYEIDSIKDRLGRTLDVYVKFIPEKQMPGEIAGATDMDPVLDDKDACSSKYGIHTVSIRIVAVKRCLFILAHEFGHVSYQAPNIQSYREYYNKFYLANTYKSASMGHNDKDPSGRVALDFARKFRAQFLSFSRTNREKMVSHFTLLQKIKDQIRKAA